MTEATIDNSLRPYISIELSPILMWAWGFTIERKIVIRILLEET